MVKLCTFGKLIMFAFCLRDTSKLIIPIFLLVNYHMLGTLILDSSDRQQPRCVLSSSTPIGVSWDVHGTANLDFDCCRIIPQNRCERGQGIKQAKWLLPQVRA